jgi:hypothetical protein
MIVKFNSTRNISANIVFCIIDTISDYKNPWIQEIVKNSIDSEISTLTFQGFDVLAGDNEDEILSECCESYDYAVVCAAGVIWADNKDFFSLIKKEIEKGFFLMGHVLDKKEGYYELHPQCYVIDLKIYKSLECPPIGKTELFSKHEKIEPIRSKENFHDEYTPVTIDPGYDKKEYFHKCHGWNIINIALTNSLPIKIFDHAIRESKRYFYPDDGKELDNLSKFYLENTIASRSWVNPFSTGLWLPEVEGPLDNLVTVCNGVDWIKYLKKYGFHDQTTVKFLDYNIMSLEFINRLIYEWDGKDYVEFLEMFGHEKLNHLGMEWNTLYGVKDRLSERWNSFKEEVDWDYTWKEIKDKVEFKIDFKDFLHKEVSSDWLDSSYNTTKTLIHLSHVYNYHSTSIFYTTEYRLEMENHTIEYLKKIAPEAFLVFDFRSWDGFLDYLPNDKLSQVKHFRTVALNELTAPPWRLSDWKK